MQSIHHKALLRKIETAVKLLEVRKYIASNLPVCLLSLFAIKPHFSLQ